MTSHWSQGPVSTLSVAATYQASVTGPCQSTKTTIIWGRPVHQESLADISNRWMCRSMGSKRELCAPAGPQQGALSPASPSAFRGVHVFRIARVVEAQHNCRQHRHTVEAAAASACSVASLLCELPGSPHDPYLHY
jgi:hypothetical protein